MALKMVTEKTLNLSGIPKYSEGTRPVPIAPININSSDSSADVESCLYLFVFIPPTIIGVANATPIKAGSVYAFHLVGYRVSLLFLIV